MSRKKSKRIGFTTLLTILTLFFIHSPVFALSDEDCMECHSDPDLTMERDGKTINLQVDHEIFKDTIHSENGCVSCHEEADVEEGEEHPMPMSSVNCGNCHEEIFETYSKSMHGVARMEAGDLLAPKCYDCHSKHAILPPSDRRSATYPLNVPATCGKCHREGSKMNQLHDIGEHNIVSNYTMSTHGKGLYVDGLVVTAVCSSCHTPHNIQIPDDPNSTVNRDHINATCSQCHVGISEKFKQSVHSPLITKTDKKLPVCIDCHTSHTITRVDQRDFRQVISSQCSNCHEHESETYFETYHGRAGLLKGGEKAAKCSDCHGSHDILPSASPGSKIHETNIVETCSPCHPKATPQFTEYLTHATHSEKDKYPSLYYTFWAMTGLLVGTFSFFGLHTLLWIPRSMVERYKKIKGIH